MADESLSRAVVIDVSLENTRIGFAGDDSCATGPPLPVNSAPAESWADDMTTALSELCKQAGGIQIEGRPICLTESLEQLHGPQENRERWLPWLFETFHAHSVYLLPQPLAALYSAGQNTGLVIDATHVVPIWEGYALRHAVKRLEASQKVSSAAFDAVFTCDCDIWQDLLLHVMVCGRDGDTSDALVAAVQTELTASVAERMPSLCTPKVRAAGHGQADAWHGASVFATLDPGTGMWIRRADFDDGGAAVVHRKCPC